MTDRPRLDTYEYARLYPDRIAVIGDGNHPRPWWVWRGKKWLGGYATHAEAITAADKLAREQVGTVWTTPDSGTQADYGLIVG